MNFKSELFYLAGIFDGEGCISVTKGQDHKSINPHYSVVVALGLTHEYIPQLLRFHFGGSVYKMKPKYLGCKPAWKWQISSSNALSFLKIIAPYLRLKRAEAELAIRFQERNKEWSYIKRPTEIKAIDEAECILMHSLKKNNQPIFEGVTK